MPPSVKTKAATKFTKVSSFMLSIIKEKKRQEAKTRIKEWEKDTQVVNEYGLKKKKNKNGDEKRRRKKPSWLLTLHGT
jgi:hypothetical protein